MTDDGQILFSDGSREATVVNTRVPQTVSIHLVSTVESNTRTDNRLFALTSAGELWDLGAPLKNGAARIFPPPVRLAVPPIKKVMISRALSAGGELYDIYAATPSLVRSGLLDADSELALLLGGAIEYNGVRSVLAGLPTDLTQVVQGLRVGFGITERVQRVSATA